MSAHEKIGAAISAANEAGRIALVPFITAGYPEPRDFIATLKDVASVGDVVELGIPFSDPMADGMTIQRSSFVALQKGVSLKWIFEQLDSAKGEIDAPLVMMSYLNPLLAFGYDKLAERALAAGVCAFIVPDLPFEESDDIRAALEAKGLGLIQLVTPATPDVRLKMLFDNGRYKKFFTKIRSTDALGFVVNPLIFSYGLPLLFGLVMGSDVSWLRKLVIMLIGYFVITLVQIWGVVWQSLKMLSFNFGEQTHSIVLSHGVSDGSIALGYQLGTLILPALAPIFVWVLTNRPLVEQFVGWQVGQLKGKRNR